MPETISETRKHLTGHVRRFRDEGIDAEPVVFGDRRRPDAALLPFETFQLLLDVTEDLVIAERVRERGARDDDGRTSHARYQRVRLLGEAIEDLQQLAQRSRPMLLAVFVPLKRLDEDAVSPTPLRDFARTDDPPYLLVLVGPIRCRETTPASIGPSPNC